MTAANRACLTVHHVTGRLVGDRESEPDRDPMSLYADYLTCSVVVVPPRDGDRDRLVENPKLANRAGREARAEPSP